jgi:hypothetical protein
MSLITRMRKQKAIYWARSTIDQYGRFTFAEPVEIKCRWDDEAAQFLTPKGEEQVSRSKVYVDRDMEPGDRLQLGELASSTPDNPLDSQDSFEIRQFAKNPDLKAREFLRTAIL